MTVPAPSYSPKWHEFCITLNIFTIVFFFVHLGHLIPGCGGNFNRRWLESFLQLSRCSSQSKRFTWVKIAWFWCYFVYVVMYCSSNNQMSNWKTLNTLERQRWQVRWVTSQFFARSSITHFTSRKRQDTWEGAFNWDGDRNVLLLIKMVTSFF